MARLTPRPRSAQALALPNLTLTVTLTLSHPNSNPNSPHTRDLPRASLSRLKILSLFLSSRCSSRCLSLFLSIFSRRRRRYTTTGLPQNHRAVRPRQRCDRTVGLPSCAAATVEQWSRHVVRARFHCYKGAHRLHDAPRYRIHKHKSECVRSLF